MATSPSARTLQSHAPGVTECHCLDAWLKHNLACDLFCGINGHVIKNCICGFSTDCGIVLTVGFGVASPLSHRLFDRWYTPYDGVLCIDHHAARQKTILIRNLHTCHIHPKNQIPETFKENKEQEQRVHAQLFSRKTHEHVMNTSSAHEAINIKLNIVDR